MALWSKMENLLMQMIGNEMKYATTILKVSVHREGVNPVFGEGNTYVKVEDEAGGPFLVIEQDDSDHHVTGLNQIRLEYEELQQVAEAGKMLMHQYWIEHEEQDHPKT